MDKASDQLTFEEWLLYVFDRPVDNLKLEWYWDAEANWWYGSPDVIVQFLTQTFENASTLLTPYSDAQLNQGLWFIASNGCSDYMFALMDKSVPWTARQRCIRSIQTLFAQCFAKRCSPHLSHIDEPGASPLNLACYMWWDLVPIGGQVGDPERAVFDQEILTVMESTLQLDSLACQEGALHGLGHWHLHYPQQVEEIVDVFLKKNESMRDELRSYAKSAYKGCVL